MQELVMTPVETLISRLEKFPRGSQVSLEIEDGKIVLAGYIPEDGAYDDEGVEVCIAPTPCNGERFKHWTIEDYLNKITEELLEVRIAYKELQKVVDTCNAKRYSSKEEYKKLVSNIAPARKNFLEELSDLVTVTTSTMEKAGFSKDDRDAMQVRVNKKNKDRGYHRVR